MRLLKKTLRGVLLSLSVAAAGCVVRTRPVRPLAGAHHCHPGGPGHNVCHRCAARGRRAAPAA